jgi:hypothetical protein
MLIVAKYLMTGKFSLFLHVGGSLDPAKASSHPPKHDMIFEIDRTIKYSAECSTKFILPTKVGSMERAEFGQLQDQCLRKYETQQQNWTTGIVAFLKSDPQKYPTSSGRRWYLLCGALARRTQKSLPLPCKPTFLTELRGQWHTVSL